MVTVVLELLISIIDIECRQTVLCEKKSTFPPMSENQELGGCASFLEIVTCAGVAPSHLTPCHPSHTYLPPQKKKKNKKC